MFYDTCKGLFMQLFIIISIFLLFLCGPADARPPLTVMTSIFPLLEFCQAVGKTQVSARLLLPPGTEPHSWEPNPSDLLMLEQSDIFLMIGAGMEPWVADMVRVLNNGKLRVVEATALVPSEEEKKPDPDGGQGSLGHHDSHGDPHFWLNLAWDQDLIDQLVSLFASFDPASAGFFRANGDEYKKKLQELDRRYKESLQGCRHRTFFVGGHAAYGHLASHYGLSQVSLYGISPNADPTPREMARVADQVKSEAVKYVFFETQVNNRLAKALAMETGTDILLIRNGANPTRQELAEGVTFISLMEENLKNLQMALECQ